MFITADQTSCDYKPKCHVAHKFEVHHLKSIIVDKIYNLCGMISELKS